MIESISAVTLATPTCRAPSTSTADMDLRSFTVVRRLNSRASWAGKTFRRESRKRLVMLGPEAN
jgi:hypothetical protein